MIRKLSACLVVWHCFAVAIAQPEPKQVTVTASLEGADSTTPRTMVFNFLNPFIRARKSAAFDETNTLACSEEMLFTQNMTILYNGIFINLVVKPGDSVHLHVDAGKLKQPCFRWLSITGDGAIVSTQVNRWHYYLSTHYTKAFGRAPSYAAMSDSIYQFYRYLGNKLNKYADSVGMLHEAYNWAINDLRYTVSYYAADYLITQDSLTGSISYNHALYRDSLFDQYNDNGFQSMMFPYHLMNYTSTLFKTDSSIHNLRKKDELKNSATKAVSLISSEPAGLVRDFMLFQCLSDYLKNRAELLDSMPDIKKLFSTSITYRYLLKAAETAKKPEIHEKAISGLTYLDTNGNSVTLPKTEILNYFTRRYPGNIIYLDVYATWCVPCLQEMDFVPNVKSRLTASNVVFINLCLQSSAKNWKDLVKKKNLSGENYFLDDDAAGLFMGTYQIGGFPTYILLDKQGKIVTRTAPRPSDSNLLIKTIDELTGR